MSPEAKTASLEVTKIWTEINADGVITPEEQMRYGQAVQAWLKIAQEDSEKIDWKEIVGGTIGGLTSAFLGVNLYRNSREKKVWGTPDGSPPSSTA